MLQRIIIGLGAGFASAILFIAPLKGIVASTLFGLVAPLPLMIAFIGFGLPAGLVGMAAALAVVGLLFNPLVCGLYAAWVAVPVGALAQVVRLRRGGAGLAVSAAAGIAIAISLALLAGAVFAYGGWSTAVSSAALALSPYIGEALRGRTLPDDVTAMDIARAIAAYAPAIAAAWTTLTLCLNLWAAARLAYASNLLPRAWPNVPDTLRLPRVLAMGLAAALALSFAPGVIGAAAAAVAAALGLGFALQGFGALHAMTRGAGGRGFILAGAYAVLVGLIPWPLILAALLGLVDCFARLPRKPARATLTI